MFLKLRPLLYTIFFTIGLEFIIFRTFGFFYIFSFLLLAAIYSGRRLGGKWGHAIPPFMLAVFSVALLQLISKPAEKQIFVALCSIMTYLALLGIYRMHQYKDDQTARGMVMAAASAAIFFAYTSSYGLYLNFLVPLWTLMFVYLLATLAISYHYFSIIGNGWKQPLVYSFLLALLMAELIWTMNFWPFGYLTTGVIALILYYVLWDLTQSYLLNILSRRRVVANMVFFTAIVSLVLLSSKWIPVI